MRHSASYYIMLLLMVCNALNILVASAVINVMNFYSCYSLLEKPISLFSVKIKFVLQFLKANCQVSYLK